jgi:superoxide dismutase, Cu-Zn family
MDTSAARLSIAFACVAVAAACASTAGRPPPIQVELQPRSGSNVTGTLALQQEKDGVLISGEVRGLAPASVHGFHVHEKGDCSAPDATSAGPHFNPNGSPHGQMGAGPHHEGDMPNIVADEHGVAQVKALIAGATLDAAPGSLRGRALVVHRDADDYKTQPAGNAGARVACGVIASPAP